MATTLAIVSLLIAVGSFGYAWLLRQDMDKATRRLDRYNRALFDANEELRTFREAQAEKMATLQAEIARLSGRAAFTPEMTIREVYAMHPQAQDILAGYHLGGCSSCAVDAADRLDQICASSGLDVADVVQNLNALFAGSQSVSENGNTSEAGNGPQQIQRVKLPNVELSF